MLKLFPQTWHLQLIICDYSYGKEFKAMQCQKCGKYSKKKQELQMHLQKSTWLVFFLVGELNILNNFYKIQNLSKWKLKQVVPFLPKNLELHNPCEEKGWKIVTPPFHLLLTQVPKSLYFIHGSESAIIFTHVFWVCLARSSLSQKVLKMYFFGLSLFLNIIFNKSKENILPNFGIFGTWYDNMGP